MTEHLKPSKILLATDAWQPQINGVVRTLGHVVQEAKALGYDVEVINPTNFKNIACPSYPEIRLAVDPFFKVDEIIKQSKPDYIHIATEGPIGMSFRKYCKRNALNFTSSFHTLFPEYLKKRVFMPRTISYAYLKKFHNAAQQTLVPTRSIKKSLRLMGFKNLKTWSRGVDTKLFKASNKDDSLFSHLPKPIHLYVGRVAIEKNIEAFLNLELNGSKVVVGDGPQLAELRVKYPSTIFTGAKKGSELAAHYASADVFVFPSKTDTFGLVILEALASGLPVAAFNAPGPKDIFYKSHLNGLGDCLKTSIHKAYKFKKQDCIEFAQKFSWASTTQIFLENLVPVNRKRIRARRNIENYQEFNLQL